MRLAAGTRVRLRGDIWPQRIGEEGVVVHDPNGPGIYPAGKRDVAAGVVIVLLDDDPLDATTEGTASAWTCAVESEHVEVIE